MDIKGLEGLAAQDVVNEVQRGGRFVIFSYTISIIIMTFKQPTSIYFLRSGEGAFVPSLPFLMITCCFGWWGFPFGPIYSIWSLVENLGGGKDVTREIMQAMAVSVPSEPMMAEAVPPQWRPS